MPWGTPYGKAHDFDSAGVLNRSSVAKATSSAVAAGDALFAFVIIGDATVTGNTISDSVNGAWSTANKIVLGTTGTLSRLELWWFPNSAAGTPTITANWLANRTFSGIFVAAVAGGVASSLADGTGGSGDPNVSAASLAVSLTTAVAGDLVIFAGNCFNGGSALTAQSPANMLETDGSGEAFWMYQVAAGIGSVSSQVNLSPNDKAAGIAMAFKPASSPDVTITPTGFALAQSLGTPAPGITLLPAGFGITASLGTPTAGSQTGVTVTPTGLALSTSLGTFTTQADATIQPGGAGLAIALGTPTVTGASGANVLISPAGFALGITLGQIPTLVLPTALTAMSIALGTPIVTLSQILSPTGFLLTLDRGIPTILGAVSSIKSIPLRFGWFGRRRRR